MKKSFLVLAATIATLTSTSIAFAFDFQELDNKVLSGEITQTQAKQIIDKAVAKGEITQDQIRQHMEQIRENCQNDKIEKGGPPPFGPGVRPDNDEFIKKLKAVGITKNQLDAAHKKGPEAIKQLLESHNIQPPCPKGPPDFRGPGPDRADFAKKLEAAGITKDELEAAQEKGPDAVKKLLKKHGIEPKKEF